MNKAKMKTTKKKKKLRFTTTNEQGGEDRLSSLSDDLIHHILSFTDAQLAVQTSTLSKRWKLVWTTLPFLNFKNYKKNDFLHKFISRRNNDTEILQMYIYCRRHLPLFLFHKIITYAISHNIQDLNLDFLGRGRGDNILSTFSSTSINKLKLTLYFDDILESHCWDLPALTTLHLMIDYPIVDCWVNLPLSYLTCFPCLQNLLLQGFNLPESISLPSLNTLFLQNCKLPTVYWDLPVLSTLTLDTIDLPTKSWDLPALSTLTLDSVEFPEKNTSDFLPSLVNLQNLTLSFWKSLKADWVINCPQLVNLEINDKLNITTTHHGKILVTSKKIRNFSAFGFFPITFEVSELENVNIKLWDHIGYRNLQPTEDMKRYYHRVTDMFPGLCSARILTLDSETIEALSSVSDFLVRSPPPFCYLNYMKVPQRYKESSMSTYLKSYLLGHSPKAFVVTTLPQDTMIPHTMAASVTAQNVVIEEPLAAPTKVLVDLENINEIVCLDTVDMGVQEGHVGQNSEVHDDRVIRHVGAPVEGTSNYNRVSSSEGKSDIGLWLGRHEVKSEFVCLLDHILNKYPETFEHFATKNKEFCTMKLNMLCTTVNNFTKILMTEVNAEMISEYRDVLAGLQKFGFNISWLVTRINYVEQLRFSQPLLPELHAIDCHINDAKSKLQDLQFQIDESKTKLQNLQTLRAEKMQEIQKAFGTMGTNLAVGGYIGDDLLPGP